MKLYKITSPAHTFEEGDSLVQITRFEGTQNDARKTRMNFELNFKDIKPAKRPRVEVEEVDVPTDKAGLLAWLNENCV